MHIGALRLSHGRIRSLSSSSSSDSSRATEDPRIRLSLAPIARAARPVLLNLVELYVHDFSEHVEVELNANGRFDHPISDDWWDGGDHAPYFIEWNNKLAGFALV